MKSIYKTTQESCTNMELFIPVRLTRDDIQKLVMRNIGNYSEVIEENCSYFTKPQIIERNHSIVSGYTAFKSPKEAEKYIALSEDDEDDFGILKIHVPIKTKIHISQVEYYVEGSSHINVQVITPVHFTTKNLLK